MTNSAGDSTCSPHPSTGRVALIVTIFCAALAASCWLLTRLLPFPALPDIAARFHYFAERKDTFDTLFIGSSRIRHQIIPPQFDAEMTEHGEPTHSLNLGSPGMWFPESYYFLRRLLALHPQHLRWVVIELMDYVLDKADLRDLTMRTVTWHDWQHTAMAFRVVTESHLAPAEKRRRLALHAWLFLQHMTNPGRGAVWLQAHFFAANAESDSPSMARGGFTPEENGEWSESRRSDYKQEIQDYQQSPARRVRPGLISALRAIAADVRGAGGEPVFVLPPTVRMDEKLADELPHDLTIWAFNNPAEYPRLYLAELHFDDGHLNEDGARVFTSLLARRLADLPRKP